MKDLFRILRFAWLRKRLTIGVFWVETALVILNALFPIVIKEIFDLLEKQIRKGDFTFSLNVYSLPLILYLLIVIFSVLFQLWEGYFETKWWYQTRNTVICKVFGHLETLDLSFFERSSTGKIIEKLSSGIDTMQSIMENIIEVLVPQMIYMIFAIIVLFTINIAFGLMIAIGVPIFTFISIKFTKPLNKLQDRVRDYEEKAGSVRVETLSNIRTVKSFATEKRHQAELSNSLKKSLKTTMRRMGMYARMDSVRFSITNGTRVFSIFIGVYWVATGKITFGTLFLVWTYVNGIYNPLWRLSRIYDNTQRDLRSTRRIFEILDTEPKIQDSQKAAGLENVDGNVEIKGLKFKYKNRNVLDGLDLKIKKGETVAIVGKSGVGKSTLVKLLLRFYDPQVGSITIDGHDIRGVTQKSLRQNIGVVLQDTAIFNDTAFNNIAYANPKASKEDVIRAAKIAHAHEFVNKLPEGYETIVGERGVKLSGGEQQRINIARAVLKNPPILILDEATSHLDSESEKLIQDALWKLIRGRTSIIIAHRLSTIMKADLIVVLDKGKISEIGTHKELVSKKSGIYHKLFEIQSGSYLK